MQGEPCTPEKLIEDIVCLTVTVRQTTAENAHFDVLVELFGSHGQALQVLDILEAGIGDATLILIIREN